jgi:hypothetical protein
LIQLSTLPRKSRWGLEMDEYLCRFIQKGMQAYLANVYLDDLFTFVAYNKVVWNYDTSISIELDVESDYPCASLDIPGFHYNLYPSFEVAVYEFTQRFLSNLTEDEN